MTKAKHIFCEGCEGRDLEIARLKESIHKAVCDEMARCILLCEKQKKEERTSAYNKGFNEGAVFEAMKNNKAGTGK